MTKERLREYRRQYYQKRKAAGQPTGLRAAPICPLPGWSSPFPAVAGRWRSEAQLDAELLSYIVSTGKPTGRVLARREVGIQTAHWETGLPRLLARRFITATDSGVVSTALGAYALPRLLESAKEQMEKEHPRSRVIRHTAARTYNKPRPPVAYESPFPVAEGKQRTASAIEADTLAYLIAAPVPMGANPAARDMGTDGGTVTKVFRRLEQRGFVALTAYGVLATPLGESAYPQLVDAAREDQIASMCHSMLTDKKRWRRRKRGSKLLSKRTRYHVLKVGRCQNCGWSVEDGATLHVDHIRPIAKGGSDHPSNLQALCADCNLGKSDYYDEPSSIFPSPDQHGIRSRPRRD